MATRPSAVRSSPKALSSHSLRRLTRHRAVRRLLAQVEGVRETSLTVDELRAHEPAGQIEQVHAVVDERSPARLAGIQVPETLTLEAVGIRGGRARHEPAVPDPASDEHRAANDTVVENLSRSAHVIMRAMVEVRHELRPGGLGGRDDLLCVFRCRREGLLAKDVLPLLHGLDTHLPVEAVGRGHHDDVDVVPGDQMPPVVHGVAPVLGAHLERQVAEGGSEVRDRDEPEVGEGADGGRLALPDRPAADDGHVEGTTLLDASSDPL